MSDLYDSAVMDLMAIKYYAARRIYPILDERTPSEKTTWREWFREKFHEDYDAYSERAAREQIGKKVGAYLNGNRSG